MRKVHKERMLGALGVVFIILAVLLFFGWEKYGREALTYEPVIVCKQDLQKGVIVEKNMLGYMNIEKNTIVKEVIKNPEEIIGKRSSTFIPAGMQLCKEFFNDPELVTGDGNNILSVPMGWIYSYPQTLRRGDLVHFYMIDQSLTATGSYGQGSEVTQLLELSDKSLVSVKIAYVKDSGNREVVDITPERMDGSAAVSGIEIVISEEKYSILKSAVEAGKMFIIMYE